MHLVVSLTNSGAHPAGWRLSSNPSGFKIGAVRKMVRGLEAAGVDAVLFGQPMGRASLLRSGIADAITADPLPVLGALASTTEHIGLGASVPVSRTEPFHTARAFAVLDLLSGGRTAWMVTPFSDDEGADLEDPAFPELTTAERYARAAEYIAVTIKLWESWEDGAVLADKESGLFADSDRVHPIDHEGQFFSVRGPLTAVRPPQGQPVIIASDVTEAGLELAAQTADVVLLSPADVPRAQALRAQLEARAQSLGRDAPRLLVNLVPVLGETAAEAEAAAHTLDDLLDWPLALALIEDRWRQRPAATPTEDRLAHAYRSVYHQTSPHGDTTAATVKDVAQQVLNERRVRLVGTPEAVAEQMQAWVANGTCDGFNLLPPVLPDHLGLIETRLLPALRRGHRASAQTKATLRERMGLARPSCR